jgi:hypothetical protein
MKKIIFVWIFCLFAVSCDDRLEEMNEERVNPAEVPAETLFANGVKELADMMVNSDVNENVFRLYAQYWAQTTYPDESAYNQIGRNIPRNWGWGIGYRQALTDLSKARDLMVAEPDPTLSAAANANKLAITDIAIAYIYAVMAETYGNIPYTEALDIDNITPAYDDARTVYDAQIDVITDAINTLDVNDVAFPANQDPIYFGDVAGWKRFANSLKLRMAIMLADVDPGKAQTMIDQTLASGLILDPSEDAYITYYSQAPSTNPIYEDLVLSGRRDYIPANTLVDKLNELNDPRRDVFFADPIGGEYVGGIYGTANSWAEFSHLGDPFFVPTLPGVLLSCSEVMFLLAEASERGLTVPETAETYYNRGIEISMLEWGLTQADYDAYIAQPDVAYATAPGDWKQKIGIQAWIALNNRGYEGWTTWRRLDFDGFNIPPMDPPLTIDDVPVRLLYPQEEANLNGTNLDAAASAIGGNTATTKLWWDVN